MGFDFIHVPLRTAFEREYSTGILVGKNIFLAKKRLGFVLQYPKNIKL
jgi:hypothetical protein